MTRASLMDEYQIPISLSAEVEDLLDEIIRLRTVVRTYGQIELAWPEKQYTTAIYAHVPTAVLFAADNPRQLFAKAIDEALDQIVTHVEQRRNP